MAEQTMTNVTEDSHSSKSEQEYIVEMEEQLRDVKLPHEGAIDALRAWNKAYPHRGLQALIGYAERATKKWAFFEMPTEGRPRGLSGMEWPEWKWRVRNIMAKRAALHECMGGPNQC